MEDTIQTFAIDNSTPLVLYGAATMGTIYYEKYAGWNLNVTAFIDKRADEIKDFLGLPCYDIENALLEKENVVVIIAVKNVFEHSLIAKKLYKAGYKNLVYRPYAALNGKGTIEENHLNDVYSSLTDAVALQLEHLSEIPVLNPCEMTPLVEHGVILKTADSVTFYLPVSMIFSDKKGENEEKQYPVLCLKPHVNFSKFIIGNGGESESLMKYCIGAAENTGTVKVTDAWKQNVILNQSEIFLDMLHKYNIEPDFFINKAVNIIWNNERGYFNLNSGKHRAAFLCAMERNYIPVKASVDDYNAYLNAVDSDKIAKSLSEQFEDGYSYPVENPYLYEFARYSENSYFNLLRKICDRLSAWYYDNGKILSALNVYNELNEAIFLDSFFIRAGFSVSKNRMLKYDIALLTDRAHKENVGAEHYLCFKNGSMEVVE